MQLLKSAVKVQLLLSEDNELGKVAAAFGFGNIGAHVAKLGFQGALLNLLDGAFDFGLFGRLGLGQQDLGEQCALSRVFHYIHGVVGSAAGQGLERRKSAKMLKERWLRGDGLGGESAGLQVFGVRDRESAEQNSLHLGQCRGLGFDSVTALEGGLTEFFAEDG